MASESDLEETHEEREGHEHKFEEIEDTSPNQDSNLSEDSSEDFHSVSNLDWSSPQSMPAWKGPQPLEYSDDDIDDHFMLDSPISSAAGALSDTPVWSRPFSQQEWTVIWEDDSET